MNVKLYLREYVNKNGKSPIYLVVTSQGKRIRQSLGIEVAPKDWDTQTSRVKKSDPDALELNLIIDNKIKKITEVRTQYLFLFSISSFYVIGYTTIPKFKLWVFTIHRPFNVLCKFRFF